jgi:hypothetical protein
VRTVREAVAAGELPPDTDAEMVRSMVYGGIEHRMWATLFGRGTIDVEPWPTTTPTWCCVACCWPTAAYRSGAARCAGS